MIQKGTILIAKNECAMNGNPNLKALIVGNHYEILAITSRNLVVKSEISDEHCFDLDSTDTSYWRNYFKLKTNPTNILSEPVKHDLSDILKELKFGRPKADQDLIDKWIEELELLNDEK